MARKKKQGKKKGKKKKQKTKQNCNGDWLEDGS
jgi:hypothetical protein